MTSEWIQELEGRKVECLMASAIGNLVESRLHGIDIENISITLCAVLFVVVRGELKVSTTREHLMA